MPFKSAKQEIAMMINSPAVWREWVKKYGHHPKFKGALSKKKGKSKKGSRKK